MIKFKENNPERLSEFLRQLNDLVDEFHPNIYTIDKVFNGLEMIEIGIKEQLNK
jgi:Holliday junction resolvasome RuvABC endonuclease subunit